MQVDFKFSIGNKVVYGTTNIIGVIQGLYQYKTEPTQALLEYVDSTGSLQTMWRSEQDFHLVE
jgi:hypothetical protein